MSVETQLDLQSYITNHLGADAQGMAGNTDDDKWKGQLRTLATDLQTAQTKVASLTNEVAGLEQALQSTADIDVADLTSDDFIFA